MHWILLAVLAVVLIWAVFTFNRLVRWRNLMREAWSGVDVQLKRRYDLIPNLAAVVRHYGEHERELFANVARLRARAVEAGDLPEQTAAENALSGGLRALFTVVEDYPDIKANRNFLDLQEGLSEVEDQIQLARRYYNGTVRNLNNLVESFPSMLVAATCGFAPGAFFEIEYATERKTPEIGL